MMVSMNLGAVATGVMASWRRCDLTSLTSRAGPHRTALSPCQGCFGGAMPLAALGISNLLLLSYLSPHCVSSSVPQWG